MKMNQIMDLITELSYSQGFYGRLKRSILELKEYDPCSYENLVEEWESKNFKDSIDFILYIEC